MEITTEWRSIEVPQGFFVCLPSEFSYVGSEMIYDPESGWCVIVIAEWAARVAEFILQEVYDDFCL